MNRSRLVKLMESHHEHFHLLFGIISFVIVVTIFPHSDIFDLVFWSIIGSFLPDIDHLFFIFIYGRNTTYATSIRTFLTRLDIAGIANFVRKHHKSNYFILSHNLLTPMLSFGLFGYFLSIGQAQFSSLSLSWTMHFVFDIIEDYLSLGRLNPNWYFKFSHPRL